MGELFVGLVDRLLRAVAGARTLEEFQLARVLDLHLPMRGREIARWSGNTAHCKNEHAAQEACKAKILAARPRKLPWLASLHSCWGRRCRGGHPPARICVDL